MSELLAGGALFMAMALLIYVVASRVEERSTMRATLRALDDYQLDNEREKELLNPLGERIVGPVMRTVLNVGRRFWPTGYAENARRKLVIAGRPTKETLDRTIASVPGPMSDEFARMLGENRAGATRAEALKALDARTEVPEVRSFVLALLQADTFGVSIGRVLRAQADEMRIRRRQTAQEKAQKAPVKMLIPMVFCIFPALFVVVIGPAIINIRSSL